MPVCHWWAFRLFLAFYWGHFSKYLWKYLCLRNSVSWFLLALCNFLMLQKISQKETDQRNTVETQGLLQGLCAPQRFVQLSYLQRKKIRLRKINIFMISQLLRFHTKFFFLYMIMHAILLWPCWVTEMLKR